MARPGPRVVPDMEDNGILSVGIKLMGVPGPKLMDDEQGTVDFSGISAPTFTTPDVSPQPPTDRRLIIAAEPAVRVRRKPGDHV